MKKLQQNQQSTLAARTQSLFPASAFRLAAGCFIIIVPLLCAALVSRGAAPSAGVGGSDVEEAWIALRNAVPAGDPPEWKTKPPSQAERDQYNAQRAEKLIAVAEKAKEFLKQVPNNQHTREARSLQIDVLSAAMKLGVKEAQAQRDEAYNEAASDQSLSEDTRWKFRLEQIKTRGNIKDINYFGEALLMLKDEFPRVQGSYDQMMQIALQDDTEIGKKLAREVLASTEAGKGYKQYAQRVLDGKVFYASKAVGKPIDVKFKALDGREVDLAKMQGKVVLIKFWATWVPGFYFEKKAYEHYHDKGFEIICISLDEDKEALLQYVKEQNLPWPQHFDGKGWKNELAVQFNVHDAPTLWLVDQKGILRDARVDFTRLEQKVALLLAGDAEWGVGKPLELRFSAVDGREVDLAKMKGKVTLLHFWSSKTLNSAEMIPALGQLYTNNPSKVEVIGINFDEKKEVLLSCIKERNLPWPQFFDGGGRNNLLAVRFGITGLPKIWVVDKKGILRETGVQSGRGLKEKVALLLAE